jgi:FtsZ-binding cell division protein ZapB
MKIAKFTLDTISKMRMDSLKSEINSLQQEYDRTREELENDNDKEVHIGVENIKWYTDSLKIENKRYDVNYLYEPTKFNIGRPSFHTARGHNIISDDIFDVNKI